MSDLDLDTPVTHPVGWTPPPYMEPVSPPPFHWTYEQSDPALMLFTAAVTRFNMTFPPHSRILELGCAESDWLERMHDKDPTFDLVGVDARGHVRAGRPGLVVREGSAMDPTLFEPASLDWVVMLGALEHFGLGYYGDPILAEGDCLTMRNVEHWLKPGGFCYFDVPAQPTYRVSEDRCYRMYSQEAITTRLIVPGLVEVNRAYSLPEPHAGTWCHAPTVERVPYWFATVLCQKETHA